MLLEKGKGKGRGEGRNPTVLGRVVYIERPWFLERAGLAYLCVKLVI